MTLRDNDGQPRPDWFNKDLLCAAGSVLFLPDGVSSLWCKDCETANLVGFARNAEGEVEVLPRFPEGERQARFFLYYMLGRTLGFEPLACALEAGGVPEVLPPLLFHVYLLAAWRHGMYRTYNTVKYDDARLRGVVDVPRFVCRDVPFRGNVAYRVRERRADNRITRLVRHTIDYLDRQGSLQMQRSQIAQAVADFRNASPSSSAAEIPWVVREAMAPIANMWHADYERLRRLCLLILRGEALDYRAGNCDVCGLLTDISWLWEEYCACILTGTDMKHPDNRKKTGAICLDKEKEWKCYPDFYNSKVVIDAKFKAKVDSDDHCQLISYMHVLSCETGVFLLPTAGGSTHHLRGRGGNIEVYGLGVPSVSGGYDDFVSEMSKRENALIEKIKDP